VCQAFVEQLSPTRSRTPGRHWAEIEARWRRRRRWWRISLKNVLSDIALPMLDVPVGVADVGVPNDRIHPEIAGLHRFCIDAEGLRRCGELDAKFFQPLLGAGRPGACPGHHLPAWAPPSTCRISPEVNVASVRNKAASTTSLTSPILPTGCSPLRKS